MVYCFGGTKPNCIVSALMTLLQETLTLPSANFNVCNDIISRQRLLLSPAWALSYWVHGGTFIIWKFSGTRAYFAEFSGTLIV